MQVTSKPNNHLLFKNLTLLFFLLITVCSCKKEVPLAPQHENFSGQPSLPVIISADSGLQILSLLTSKGYGNQLLKVAKDDDFQNVEALDNRLKQMNEIIKSLSTKYELKESEAAQILDSAINTYRRKLLLAGEKDLWRLNYVNKPKLNKLSTLKGFKDNKTSNGIITPQLGIDIIGLDINIIKGNWYLLTITADIDCYHIIQSNMYEYLMYLDYSKNLYSDQVPIFRDKFYEFFARVHTAMQACESPPTEPDPIDEYWGGGYWGGGNNNNNNTLPTTSNNTKRELNTDSLKIKYPCADKLIAQPLFNSEAMSQFVEPFLTPQKPTITYKTSNNLPWGSTTTGGEFVLGNAGYDPTSGLGLSSIVTLNEKMLENSSQLLIASTIVHETMHSYIYYNISKAEDDVKKGYKDNTNWMAALNGFYLIKDLPPNYASHAQMLVLYFDKAVEVLKVWSNTQTKTYPTKDLAMAMLYGLDTVDPGTSQSMTNNINSAYSLIMLKYDINQNELDAFHKANLDSFLKLPKTDCN